MVGWQIRRLVSYVRKLRRRCEQAKHPDIQAIKSLITVRRRPRRGACDKFGFPESEDEDEDEEKEAEEGEDEPFPGQPL